MRFDTKLYYTKLNYFQIEMIMALDKALFLVVAKNPKFICHRIKMKTPLAVGIVWYYISCVFDLWRFSVS